MFRSPQGCVRHLRGCKIYIFLRRAHPHSPSRSVCMDADVSSFEVHPHQGAFRMAGGWLPARAPPPPCSSVEACTKLTSVAAMCSRALLGTRVDTHSRGRSETKGATIFHETGAACESHVPASSCLVPGAPRKTELTGSSLGSMVYHAYLHLRFQISNYNRRQR